MKIGVPWLIKLIPGIPQYIIDMVTKTLADIKAGLHPKIARAVLKQNIKDSLSSVANSSDPKEL